MEIVRNETVQGIIALEDALKAMDQVDLPLGHYQIPGVYVRAMMIPKGTVLTGKIHNHKCISIVAKGSISVASKDGMKRLDAGWIGVSEEGIKRAGYAHEDTVFITVHQCDETEICEIENYLVSETFEEFEQRLLQ